MPKDANKGMLFVRTTLLAEYLAQKYIADSNKVEQKNYLSYIKQFKARLKNSQIFYMYTSILKHVFDERYLWSY